MKSKVRFLVFLVFLSILLMFHSLLSVSVRYVINLIHIPILSGEKYRKQREHSNDLLNKRNTSANGEVKKTNFAYYAMGKNNDQNGNRKPIDKEDGPIGHDYVLGHNKPRPEICPMFGEQIKVIVLINTSPSRYDQRTAIRDTWAKQSKTVVVAFFTGTTRHKNLIESMKTEDEMHSDMIQGRFVDNKVNLTLKTISMMEWVSIYCYKAKFFMKSDDDVFINVNLLNKLTNEISNKTDTFYGKYAFNWTKTRNYYYNFDKQSKKTAIKWILPDFITGPTYFLPAHLCEKLFYESLKMNYLYMEDYFMTGMLAERLKIKLKDVTLFRDSIITICTARTRICIINVSTSVMLHLWAQVQKRREICKLPLAIGYLTPQVAPVEMHIFRFEKKKN